MFIKLTELFLIQYSIIINKPCEQFTPENIYNINVEYDAT